MKTDKSERVPVELREKITDMVKRTVAAVALVSILTFVWLVIVSLPDNYHGNNELATLITCGIIIAFNFTLTVLAVVRLIRSARHPEDYSICKARVTNPHVKRNRYSYYLDCELVFKGENKEAVVKKHSFRLGSRLKDYSENPEYWVSVAYDPKRDRFIVIDDITKK